MPKIIVLSYGEMHLPENVRKGQAASLARQIAPFTGSETIAFRPYTGEAGRNLNLVNYYLIRDFSKHRFPTSFDDRLAEMGVFEDEQSVVDRYLHFFESLPAVMGDRCVDSVLVSTNFDALRVAGRGFNRDDGAPKTNPYGYEFKAFEVRP